MSEVVTEHDECVAQLQRERADFLNYKHRVARERADDRERTRDEILRQLLPAIDDLDRALGQVPDELRDHPWTQGIALAHQRFFEVLRQLGVERVGTQGDRFDPSIHEAVAYQEQPEAAEPQVQSVVRAGYRLGPRLLRAAQVVVAGPPRNGRHNDGQSHRH
jgi:molecular chaperone GrpE